MYGIDLSRARLLNLVVQIDLVRSHPADAVNVSPTSGEKGDDFNSMINPVVYFFTVKVRPAFFPDV